MPYFNLKFLHIIKWWCYSAGNSKETRYTVGQRSTVFSHSVILISVSAQYLEKERMEFDQNLHMHWYLHNLSSDCSIHVIIAWWPRERFDSHFREIGFSIRVDLMECVKHRSLQFRVLPEFFILLFGKYFTCFEYATVWTTDTRGDQLNYFMLGVISHASVKANFIIFD